MTALSEDFQEGFSLIQQAQSNLCEDLERFCDTVRDDIQTAIEGIHRGNNRNPHGFDMSKMRVPEPKPYSGARDARELENFIFDMEQYLRILRVPEGEEMLTVATMFLCDDAKLWWRTVKGDVVAGRPRFNSWADLKSELKVHFYPENTEYHARCKLSELQQSGTIREYVQKFSSIMLDISDMAEADRLYNFQRGLKQWVRNELRRHRVTNLASVMAIVEGLEDYADVSNKRKVPPAPDRFESRPNKMARSSFAQGERRPFFGGRNDGRFEQRVRGNEDRLNRGEPSLAQRT